MKHEAAKAVRRIVTIDDEKGESRAICDGPSPDVRTDPARPGYASTRIWVTDRTPARIKGVRETLHLTHALEPPAGGSVCRVVTFPPDESYRGKVGAKEVRAFFAAMGSPGASTYSSDGFHPNDTGYGYLASGMLQAINSPSSYPAPRSSCSQMLLVPGL